MYLKHSHYSAAWLAEKVGLQRCFTAQWGLGRKWLTVELFMLIMETIAIRHVYRRIREMVKVSVIVPVYNQEKYIERCVDSILAQTLQEIEVILVDDGSTDSTPDILDKYQQKDDRIRVLHQQNQYAGVARNHGMQAAQGEYVIFWDSDDYFPEDALEVLYDECKTCDADICVGSAVKMDMHDGTEKQNCYLNWDRIPEKRPFNVNDMPQYIFNFGINCPWNKIYKNKFIEDNNLKFSTLKHANDVYFVMIAFILADKITVVDKDVVYYQFRNEGSLSCNSINNKENVLRAFLEVKDFLKNLGYWENPDIRKSYANKAFSSLAARFSTLDKYEDYEILYNFQKEQALPALELEESYVEQMYSEKNAWELSCMLSCDAEEYIFKQYLYYQKRTLRYRDRITVVRGKLERTSAKNAKQKEKIEGLKLDKQKKTEKILKQREKIESQKDRIQRQSEKIETQSEKIQSQKALLDKKLVRAALKVQNLFT